MSKYKYKHPVEIVKYQPGMEQGFMDEYGNTHKTIESIPQGHFSIPYLSTDFHPFERKLYSDSYIITYHNGSQNVVGEEYIKENFQAVLDFESVEE